MPPRLDCLVIGSGPSGVACASALLAQGRSVLIVDAGLTIDEAGAAASTETKRIPRKLIYGSDFPYRGASEHLKLDAHAMGAEPSFARGGLSNAWGAAALPYAAHDIADWPLSAEDLAPHYAACADMLGIAGEDDDLTEWLPLYAPPRGQLRASNQAQTLLHQMQRNRDRLHAQGLRFGRARAAVKARDCTYCGLCLRGCPDKLIYSAAQTLEALSANPRFSYRADVVVETLSETSDGAITRGVQRQSGEALSFEANRIFIAAGALPTTAVLLRSAGAYDQTLRMKDSQYFLAPLALFRGAASARKEDLHTMAQLFLELRDPAISPHTIHMQVYTYNDVMAEAMRQRLGVFSPLARFGDAHFVLIQGYLHSNHSGEIELTLRQDRLEARGIPNPEARKRIIALMRKLMQLAPSIGAIPLTPLMEITEPGRGFHIGGAFPMQATPQRFETDLLGRPFGWTRIHAVDASILPSIPATTITYPVMANAHRIGTEAGALQ